MIKLQHKIDSFQNTSTNIDAKDVEDIVASYDGMIEEMEFEIPHFIQKRVKKHSNFNLQLRLMSKDDCAAELCCIKTENDIILDTLL